RLRRTARGADQRGAAALLGFMAIAAQARSLRACLSAHHRLPACSSAGAGAKTRPRSGGCRFEAPFCASAAVGSTFLIGGSSSVYGSLLGRHDYVIEDVPIAIPGLSRAFDGFSIVQLSDIHIGQFVGEPELRAAETLVRQAAPDLIVLTGDLLDHDPRFAEHLGRFVRRLEPLARHGVCVVSGNHDFYAGI